ncbi:PKD domain-containing protein [Chitinophaga sp. MM2321]|uniref:PKD domain-containing protein n=1 Tax=Chitinophaga sp. MM2321 TaxID=3137178 RepID=UPI0032D5AD86
MYLFIPVERKLIALALSLLFCCLLSLAAKAQLKADFTASSTSECEPLTSTTFNDISTGNPTSWKWDLGNGSVSTERNPKASYVKPGTYTVTLTVKDASGASSTETKTSYISVWSKPVVDFSVTPAIGCAPLQTTFTDKSNPVSGTLNEFTWDFGDGTNGSGSSVGHTYNTPSVYTVILSVTNSHGCTNFKVMDKAVDVAPAINADFTVTEKILCKAPVDVLFTNTSTGPGTLNYKWEFDDGVTTAVKDPGKHTFTSKGTHSIRLTVTNDRKCSATKIADDINVANYKTDFTFPTPICTDNYNNYVASFSPASPASITWEFNGVNSWTNYNTANYSSAAAGPLKVKLTAQYGNCLDVVEKDLVVKASPTANISTDNQPICNVPATVNFKDNSTGATSWKWDFGDGQSSTAQSPSHTYNYESYFYVYLTATNAAGCAVTSNTNFGIYKTNITAYASVTSGCEGMEPAFFASSSSSDQIKTYEWDFGDATPKSTEATPTHLYAKAGHYTVKLKYTTVNGCTGTVNTKSAVDIYKKPTPDFYSPSAPTVCGNTPTSFINKTDIGDSYQWDFGDGLYQENYTPNPTHSYKEPGVYDVTLTVGNYTCYNSVTKKAYITAIDPFPRFSQNALDCKQRTILSFDEHSIGATGWKWTWGDGKDTSYSVQGNPITHIYSKTGVYTVTLTTTAGACTTSETRQVQMIAPSPITITSDVTTLCSNESVAAKVTAYDPSIYSSNYAWSWLANNVNQSWWYEKTQFTYTNLQPGKQAIQVVVQNNLGCYDSSNVIDIAVRGPVAGFNLPSTIECRDKEVAFTDATDLTYSKGIKKWEWNFGDGTSPQTFTSGPFKHTYKTAGYYITPAVTVTDIEGCVSSYAGQQLQVNGPNANFYMANSLIKPGSDAYFYDNSNEVGGTITSMLWDFGDGNTATDFYGTTHNYPDKGLYEVKLQIKDDNGCEDEMVQQLKVSSVGAGFTYTSSFVNGGSCAPMVFRFTNTSLNFASCFWDFGDGSTSDQINPVHTYTESGHYKVILKVKGDADTEDESEEIVEVKGPFATITASDEGGCLEKEIEFTVIAPDAQELSWDFTDGIIEQTKELQIKHAFKVPGIYKPRLLMKDAAGCKGSAMLDHPIVIDQLDIQLNPSPAFICDEGQLTFAPVFNSFSIEDLGKPGTYQWTFDPLLAPTDITTATPGFYLDKPGKYDFSLTATTVYGCKETVPVTINVYPKPLAAISGSDQVCKDANIDFSGSVTKATDVTWKWDFGNGQTDTQQQPAATSFATTGNFDIALTVTSKDGCTHEAHHPLLVLPLPVINASAPSDFVCLHNTILLHAGGGSQYEWTPATGLDNPLLPEPKASPEETTTYQVKVTDNNGCINTDEITLRVVQPFTIQATPDTIICLGDKLPLRVWGADYYKWEGTGLDNTGNASTQATLTSKGRYTYNVTGYDRENCFSDNTTLQVQVNQAPTVELGPDRQIMAGIPLNLTATSTSRDVMRWKWSPVTSVDCYYCPVIQVTPNLTTQYTLEVENIYGCKAKDDMMVYVICNQGAIFMPNAFTPNHDGQNERCYPKGKGVKEIAYLKIYDRWGTLVFENAHFQLNSPSAGWDGRSKGKEAPIGTYIYMMQTVCENGEIFDFRGNITLIK